MNDQTGQIEDAAASELPEYKSKDDIRVESKESDNQYAVLKVLKYSTGSRNVSQ